MWNRVVIGPFVYLYILVGVFVSVALGFAVTNKILLPLFNIAVSYPVLFTLLKQNKRKRAFGTMLFWAFCMALATVWGSMYFPERGENSIVYGSAYVEEMFHWIQTGQGTESAPEKFIPQHLLHFVIFVILSVCSAGLLALLMGALLMNYMSFYVGSVAHESVNPFLAAIIAWHPWAIVRVVSFVILGVILAEPLICRFTKRDYSYEGARPYFWAALTGLAVDILLKTLLAPSWSRMLRRLLD